LLIGCRSKPAGLQIRCRSRAASTCTLLMCCRSNSARLLIPCRSKAGTTLSLLIRCRSNAALLQIPCRSNVASACTLLIGCRSNAAPPVLEPGALGERHQQPLDAGKPCADIGHLQPFPRRLVARPARPPRRIAALSFDEGHDPAPFPVSASRCGFFAPCQPKAYYTL